MPLKEPKEIKHCLAGDKSCSSWFERVLQETSWETWNNRWARTLPRKAARGLADVMTVNCQVHESRSSLRYKEKRSRWTRWHHPLAPVPATEGTQHCCELCKLCSGFWAGVQGLQVPELHQRASLSAPPLLTLKVPWPLLCSGHSLETSLWTQVHFTTAFMMEIYTRLMHTKRKYTNIHLQKLDTGKSV